MNNFSRKIVVPKNKIVSEKIQIVIARYLEDISWTKQFNNVLIYNKGETLKDYNNVVCLENVGKEGHTYYTHIYENYHNLADYTVFLQGRPFDHSPNIISNLRKYINKEKLNNSFEFLSETIHPCTTSKCFFHKCIPVENVYKILFDKSEEFFFQFGAGAQFAVSKQRVLERPREFYLKIVKLLEYSKNPIEGFCVERLHPIIFSEKNK